MKFEWDEPKHAKTLRDRGIGFDDGVRIFAGPVLIWEDARREYEGRFRALVLRLRRTIHPVRHGRARPGHPRTAVHVFDVPVDARIKSGHDEVVGIVHHLNGSEH